VVLGEELEDDVLADLGVDSVGSECKAILANGHLVGRLAGSGSGWQRRGNRGRGPVGSGIVGESQGKGAESSGDESCGNHDERVWSWET